MSFEPMPALQLVEAQDEFTVCSLRRRSSSEWNSARYQRVRAVLEPGYALITAMKRRCSPPGNWR